MIWTAGAIRPDRDLSIDVADRTFEHGLGLFETLRTWDGRPALLEDHRARMVRSARALGLPLDPASLPGEEAVHRLLEAEGVPGDRRLRITATGGSGSGRSIVWMRSGPLPPPPGPAGARVVVGAWRVLRDDPLARHKSLNYWSRRQAHDRAGQLGCDEAVSEADGVLWEGSRTNLFAIRDGLIRTPTTSGPIVPGVMRALVVAAARGLGLAVAEPEGIDPVEIEAADEVFLTNSVRGIIPVGRVRRLDPDGDRDWTPPGPLTRALAASIAGRLGQGARTP